MKPARDPTYKPKPEPVHNPRKSDHDLHPHERRRKGALLRRHFAGAHNAAKPLRHADGRPTRHALMAARVGEPVPTTKAHVRALAGKGRKMLAGLKGG